jgi:hypothetical protein
VKSIGVPMLFCFLMDFNQKKRLSGQDALD